MLSQDGYFNRTKNQNYVPAKKAGTRGLQAGGMLLGNKL